MKTTVFYLLPTLDYGGATRIALSFASRASGYGFVLKFGLISPGPFAQTLPKHVDIVGLKGNEKLYDMLPRPLKFLIILTRLIRVLEVEQPDVVIADVTVMGGLAVLAAIMLRKPFILLLRMGNLKSRSLKTQHKLASFFEYFIVKFLFPGADYIIVPTKSVREDLIKHFKIPSSKIVVIPNPLELEEIALQASKAESDGETKPQQPTFVYIGRLSKRKGVNYLLEAFASIAKIENVQLQIIGDGPERKALENMAERLGIKDKVHFCGSKKNPFCYLQRAVACVHPALWDGFGYVVAEAMACGVPPVVFANSGGPSEIVENGKNGIIVSQGSVQELAEAMLALLKNKELRVRLSVGASNKAKEWSADVVVRKYAEFIQSAMKFQRRRQR